MSVSTGPDVVTVRLMHRAAPSGVVDGRRSPGCSANVAVPIVTDPSAVGVGSLKARTVPHVAMYGGSAEPGAAHPRSRARAAPAVALLLLKKRSDRISPFRCRVRLFGHDDLRLGRRGGLSVGVEILTAGFPDRLALGVRRIRSEERRVGKECRSRWWADQYKEKEKKER